MRVNQRYSKVLLVLSTCAIALFAANLKLSDVLAEKSNDFWHWKSPDAAGGFPQDCPSSVVFWINTKNFELLPIQQYWIREWVKDLSIIDSQYAWNISVRIYNRGNSNTDAIHKAIISEFGKLDIPVEYDAFLEILEMPSNFTQGYVVCSARLKGGASPIEREPLSPFDTTQDDNVEVQYDYKPAIYIYPPASTNVKVFIRYNGSLTLTYPPINKENNSWNVWVDNDGWIGNSKDSKEFRYLYWEGNGLYTYDLERRFDIVKTDELLSYLDSNLTKAGLNSSEKQDFISFWACRFNNVPYVQIHLADSLEYDARAELTIIPKPDYINRVFVVFKPMKSADKISPIKQVWDRPKRSGFAVVEWGGTIIGNDSRSSDD